MTGEDDRVTISIRLTPDQREWLRRVAQETGQPEDALVAQAIQILRRISSYRDRPTRFVRRPL
jgi:hypothetical protein